MQNEMFRKIVTTKRYEIPPTNMKKDTRYLNSTNSFYQGIEGSNDLITIRGKKVPIAYEYVVGIKRGYTDEAMNCLVTSAEMDDKSYIAVVLKSNGNAMYQDTRLLLDLGLFGLSTHVLNEKEEVIDTLQINNKKETKIPLYPEHEVVIDLESDVDPASLVKKININNSIELPVLKGEVLGSVGYYLNDELLVSVPLISNDDFDGEDLLNEITNMIFINKRPLFSKAWFINLLTRLLIALLLWRSIVTAIRVQKLKRRKIAR
jgi:D-alanyl-D-alanine carboxypeptidase (penicillin-binding protein 5/6)